MEIIYEFVEKLSASEVADVFKKSGITRPVDDLERIQRMIDHADIIVTARKNGQLVGIARAITDYSYCCYLSDLAVDAEYQRLGIGKELIRIIQEKIGEEVSLVLVAAQNAIEYYPRVGFDKLDNAFSIRRKC
ncbi:GNAT family N-acetyltransferase [Neobacillus massiliamazoniensis]|uniref:N-acetyltransferase GCN5 n=1 Tax=Neobacillus massiliamazoniensis TaxID=1499688 RepID=A0A0U1NU86_9BACI|nr:GNAT family N-acetyltransferase [Neobacillus massiliamazoniensis]CRK81594.1 N-acetyltransferase GCN5 [Neobacillus massiliamazoniensis]